MTSQAARSAVREMAKQDGRSETGHVGEISQASVITSEVAYTRSPGSSPHSFNMNAASLRISVTDSAGETTNLSLQRFLDVTGLGKLYTAAAKLDGPARAPAPFGLSGSMQDFLREEDLQTVIGSVWDVTGNGTQNASQSFFFPRKSGVKEFRTGCIVGLISGEITDIGEVMRRKEGMCVVVTDASPKYKGGPVPTAEEEAAGHWCCFIGQVKVLVDGTVTRGEPIGPRMDGSGVGSVGRVGKQPVIGVAVSEKLIPVPGLVDVLCFAGLNTLSPCPVEKLGVGKPELQAMMDQSVDMAYRVQRLEGAVEILDTRLLVNEEITAETEQQVRELTSQFQELRQTLDANPSSVDGKSCESIELAHALPALRAASHPGGGSFSVAEPLHQDGGWGKKRKLWLLAAVVLVLVAAGVAAAFVLTPSGGNGAAAQPAAVGAEDSASDGPNPLQGRCDDCRAVGIEAANITALTAGQALGAVDVTCEDLELLLTTVRDCGVAIDQEAAESFCCQRLVDNADPLLRLRFQTLCGRDPATLVCPAIYPGED